MPVPESLTTDCKKVTIPDNLKQSELIALFLETLIYLKECNEKIIKIREIDGD